MCRRVNESSIQFGLELNKNLLVFRFRRQLDALAAYAAQIKKPFRTCYYACS